ncbi:MAG TPA: hypothetical protein VIV35_06880 [Chitinophagaceae bacterium]
MFIGSSRTHSTIYPKIIDSITGLSSYNAGVDGGSMRDFKMTLDGYLVNHPSPKFLFLTIDPASYERSGTIYDPIQYFPFIKKNKVIEKAFLSMGYYTFLMKNVPVLNFIYMDDYSKNNAIAGLMGKTEIPAGEFQDNGFLSNTRKCLDSTDKYKNGFGTISPDPKNINMFQSMIDTCINRNIQLVITYAPEYKHRLKSLISNFNTFIGLMYDKVNANKLMYYRDDSLAMNTDSCLFKDLLHVNVYGAVVYSKILGQRIKMLRE